MSLCGGRCSFGFCTSCAAKTYQLLGRRNFLHSRGGLQQCRGLQCDGCRAPTQIAVVLSVKSALMKHVLMSDEGAEMNDDNDGRTADLALLNTRVALRGCERAEMLMTTTIEGGRETAQSVLLRNEPGVSVRLCDGLDEHEEFDVSMLPDPTDTEVGAP